MGRRREISDGARIAHWLRVAGLTQADLARAVGVTEQAVSSWIKGRNAPTMENTKAIANACGVELRTFFGEIDAADSPTGAAS